MEKEKLFCCGNSDNAGKLVGKCGYFGDSEEEIQQQLDSGAAVKNCVRVDIGEDYSAFYPKPDAGTLTRSYSYFYCIDPIKPAEKQLQLSSYEAPLYEMQQYCLQQFNKIKLVDCVSMAQIYNYAESVSDMSDTAKELYSDMTDWYNSKQNQLREFLVSELNNEECIDSDVLRSYADKLDAVDNLSCGAPDFNEMQEMLDEYNL